MKERNYLIIALCLLVFPIFLRILAGDPVLYTNESHQYLEEQNPYGVLLRMLSSLGDFRLLISILAGVLSASLAYRLTPKLKEFRIFLLANPIFMTIFTTLNPYALAIPLVLLAIYKPKHTALLAIVTSFFVPFFSLLLLAQLGFRNQHQLLYALPLSLFGAMAAGLPQISSIIFSEFSAPLGISLVITILGLCELVLSWRQEKQLLPFLMLIPLTFYYPALLAIGLFTAWLAARFAQRLNKHNWKLADISSIAPVLLACIFLFLIISHARVIMATPPSHDLLQSLAERPGIILAPPELHAIIRERSGLTPYSCTDCNDISELYATRSMNTAQEILDNTDITYILITARMKDTVWNRDDEGLLFLLTHNPRFTLLSRHGNLELWRYERQRS